MNYYQMIEYCVYIGCVAPIVLLGVRVLVLWAFSLLKRWGTE
jgi:hypothetical protein